MRIFRLVKHLKGLQVMFVTLIESLPALWNVSSVLLLVFFVYATMGMSLFGGIPYGSFLTRHANFDNFGRAMITLYVKLNILSTKQKHMSLHV